MGRIIFGVICLLVVAMDFALTYIIAKKKIKGDYNLAATIVSSAFACFNYMMSMMTRSYFITSFFSSLYFCAITVTCLFLLGYVLCYTNVKFNKPVYIFGGVTVFFVIIDVIIELINPFKEISISYTYRPNQVSMWKYEPMFLYNLHLVLCYIIIACTFALIIYNAIKVPAAYRLKYLSVLLGVLFVVVLNGIFLFLQTENMLDVSVLFYSLIGYYMVWNRYYYSSHGMLAGIRQLILDELEQPVVLFGRDNEYAMANEQAKEFVEKYSNIDDLTMDEFIENCNFPAHKWDEEETLHFQWHYKKGEKVTTYRVDYKILSDKKKKVIGKLFVLTDTSLELDLLTGFMSKNTFMRYFGEQKVEVKYPAAIAICDLNKLAFINKTLGEDKGDLAIRSLAQIMRDIFPENCYFARLEDANLLVVCPDTDYEKMRTYLSMVRSELAEVKGFPKVLEFQSAISVATKRKSNIIDAMDTAMFSMRSKKLMDGNSSHSSLLDSLAQTLSESDSTTDEHVKRTKELGEKLGKRLGFSDVQQSNLALLCLLHDIGKLGIPMEILNKPGKLNMAEWDVMKSHVEKGYRIAKASTELEGIADFILHHHESWNGKGYPDGLKQEAIPLLSRVIAVVDTYDAMTNDRPYHKAVGDKKARAELKRCAGIQFDPYIVAEFLDMLNEIKPLPKDDVDNTPKSYTVEDIPEDAPCGVREIFAPSDDNYLVRPLHYSRYLLDMENNIISVDAVFEEITGYRQEDLSVYNLRQEDLIPEEDKEKYLQYVEELIKANQEAYLEHRIVRKDGSIRDVVCFGRPYFDHVAELARTEIITFDVAQTRALLKMQKLERESAKRSIDKWESMVRRDSLTGVLNHESFINDVEMELLNNDQIVVLMILDVDYFKHYNDNYGHLEGDKMLSLVAMMLDSAVKDLGIAGRLGGDEFAAIMKLPVDTEKEEIEQNVERVFSLVMNTSCAQEKGATISLGAAYFEDEEEGGFNRLYQKADKALYRAKDKGRKTYSL